jgi:hypothetical protein
MGEKVDVSMLSDQELKDRIQGVALELPRDVVHGEPTMDAMRAELLRRLRARHEAGGDQGGPDNPAGVREPRRPTPPGSAAETDPARVEP